VHVLGFRDQADLFSEGDRIIDQLERREPLTAVDWARTVLATEALKHRGVSIETVPDDPSLLRCTVTTED
jgi:hypothetical protein